MLALLDLHHSITTLTKIKPMHFHQHIAKVQQCVQIFWCPRENSEVIGIDQRRYTVHSRPFVFQVCKNTAQRPPIVWWPLRTTTCTAPVIVDTSAAAPSGSPENWSPELPTQHVLRHQCGILGEGRCWAPPGQDLSGGSTESPGPNCHKLLRYSAQSRCTAGTNRSSSMHCPAWKLFWSSTSARLCPHLKASFHHQSGYTL